jgi:hypothetical protein
MANKLVHTDLLRSPSRFFFSFLFFLFPLLLLFPLKQQKRKRKNLFNNKKELFFDCGTFVLFVLSPSSSFPYSKENKAKTQKTLSSLTSAKIKHKN